MPLQEFTKLLLISIPVLLLSTSCSEDNNSQKSARVPSGDTTVSARAKYIRDIENLDVIYPTTKKVDQLDTFFGTVVSDPYRWLENEEDKETEAINTWVNLQNELSSHYLEAIPYRQKVANRLKELWNYEKYSAPYKEGAYLYFYKNEGLQNQSVLYQQKGLDAKPKVFLDPNSFSEDGTSSLAGITFSKDGKYAAYAVSSSGSDWRTVQVIEAATGKIRKDTVNWVRYSGISWYKDGFFYSRYDDTNEHNKYTAPNEFHKVYYHKLGTTQSEDKSIYADHSVPKLRFYAYTTEDERYLILYESESTSGNALIYQDLNSKNSVMHRLIDGLDNDYEVIDNDNQILYVKTNYKAPNYRLIAINLNNPEPENWKDVIPQTEHVLKSVKNMNGRWICNYLEHASNKVKVFDKKGELVGRLKLPTELQVGQGVPVTIGSISGKKKDKEGFFTVTAYTIPTVICSFNAETLETQVWKKPTLKYNISDYKTDQISYLSKDGTKIRMFVTYKNGMQKDGANPVILYGYGGFNISLTPRFALPYLPFLEQGGIYVVANLRGGGEYGEKWYKAGTQLQKQNVFDDFIAAAEHLIKQKYTSKGKLAIQGRSNGGLLVGACMTQRPDLFQVAMPAVGVLDMLRYHKFTIGYAWAKDYGTSEDSKDMFEYLHHYSPVHNAKPQAYPATLVTTADHDDRVVPAHSYKFISALQAAQTGQAPVLIRIDKKAGHGAGKPTDLRIEEYADELAFIMFNLNIKDFK